MACSFAPKRAPHWTREPRRAARLARPVAASLCLAALAAGCPGGRDAPPADAAPDAARPDDAAPDGAPTPGGRAWAPNDVSILWPAPTAATRARFVRYVRPASEPGPYVPPLGASDDFPPQLHADLPRGAGYDGAVLVATRYDPCAHRAGVAGCEAQLRLAFQAIDLSLDDTGIHLFYRLDAAAAADVEARLWSLRERAGVPTGGALSVHPALARDVDGEFARGLRALLAEHAREDRLVRATFNAFAFDNWIFTQFDRGPRGFERAPLRSLPGTPTSQSWLRRGQQDDNDDPTGQIEPAPADGFDYFLSRATFEAALDPARARAARRAILRVENPRLLRNDDGDCVSCHVAGPAHQFAARRGVPFDQDPDVAYQPPSGIETAASPAPEVDGLLSVTVAFGYHVSPRRMTVTPVISARVAHETAEVVAALRARPAR